MIPSLVSPLRSLLPSRCILNRFYSEGTPIPTRKNWHTAGIPSPPSLIPGSPNEDPVPLEEDDPSETRSRKILPRNSLRPARRPTPAQWAKHRTVLRESFPEGWAPPRKLSREAMEALRQLHRLDPEICTVPMLAERFKISPEAVRRILRSKWEPSRERRIELVRQEKGWAREREQGRIAKETEAFTRMEDEQGTKYRWGSDRLSFAPEEPE